jgi:uncharacterized membrane protein
MNPRNLRWLYDELPGLVAAGVIPQETAERLRAHYGPVPEGGAASLAKILIAILGTLLIGSGIILTLASNWDELGRPARSVLSFMPLLLGQALAAYTLWRQMDSIAWREGASAFLALAIGASIALVGQTYHIPGNLASFLFTWLLLALPLIYLYRSATVAMLYFIGATGWAMEAQHQGGHALWYWALLAGALPFLWLEHRRDREAPRNAFLGWVLCLNLCVGVGVSLEKVLPGLWIVIYTAMFAAFCLLGRESLTGRAGQPFRLVGGVGTIVLALMLTFDFAWNDIGYRYYRGGNARYLEWVGVADYVLVLVALSAVVVLAVRCASRKEWHALAWVISPVLACVFFALFSLETAENFEGVSILAYNLYLFILGIAVLRSGIVSGRIATANAGMGILALFFTIRFFDSDMGILFRGVAFILIGMGFLGANLWMSRRAAKHKEIAS